MPLNIPVRGLAYTTAITLTNPSTGGFAVNPPLVVGDVKVSKDFGAFVNIATLPTVAPTGGIIVKVALSSQEMDADVVILHFKDQDAPPAWDERVLIIHPQRSLAIGGNVVADVGNSTTTFKTSLTAATNDLYATQFIRFLDGANKDVVRKVMAYDGGTKVLTVDSPLPAVPAGGDSFAILGGR
ncbi:MAG: hypothetical protein KatS3mg038_3170 [Candidatus Kapaibacterium sp.]|nr:MAG: hypothetical protein KatS3mg038_0407 [Candidatus Kapabacteria bacterium]GIV50987.1 MAG: hypothetical protein KatS3mg038_1508 [Candidatus Kapabacteria bacterium]GIV51165.1 MAG: hypothetical protein KatS3mg038_1686 [Candidatus Kapabacteria bacterium]GIV51252.1 MAG: hypothetical protein KatS3mg038_1773 [Candidatus Kapabacteria bacterium]GIV51370.1 MAG: hypothetical protein KatS3mg038_1891 [Candidatus Kapabacteria bacterium]